MKQIMNKSINKIERVKTDPILISDGMVWFNINENTYKCVINNKIECFLTNYNIMEYIDSALSSDSFKISFDDVDEIIIKHNKNTIDFIYRIYDIVENSEIHASISSIDENEFIIKFVDRITGNIYIKF